MPVSHINKIRKCPLSLYSLAPVAEVESTLMVLKTIVLPIKLDRYGVSKEFRTPNSTLMRGVLYHWATDTSFPYLQYNSIIIFNIFLFFTTQNFCTKFSKCSLYSRIAAFQLQFPFKLMSPQFLTTKISSCLLGVSNQTRTGISRVTICCPTLRLWTPSLEIPVGFEPTYNEVAARSLNHLSTVPWQ